MADKAIRCATKVEADAIAAKLNAVAHPPATLRDRKGVGRHRPLAEVRTTMATMPQPLDGEWVVVVPEDPARRARLSALETARIVDRPAPSKEAPSVAVKLK